MWHFHPSALAEDQPTQELFLRFAPDSKAGLLSHGEQGSDGRSSVGECMAYVRQVLESFEMEPIPHPVSKDV